MNGVAVTTAKSWSRKARACTVSFFLRLNEKSSKTQTDYAAVKVWFEKASEKRWRQLKVNRKGVLIYKRTKLLNVSAGDVLLVSSDLCKAIKDLEKGS